MMEFSRGIPGKIWKTGTGERYPGGETDEKRALTWQFMPNGT
jgi:hypothetical protein